MRVERSESFHNEQRLSLPLDPACVFYNNGKQTGIMSTDPSIKTPDWLAQ